MLYSRGFCNLHYANPGEIAVYGAFVDGDKLPFAYSSYSHVSYSYTREMLSYMSLNSNSVVESSRAWNAVWAPENTMSVLFSYSQERIKEECRKNGTELSGVITSINPNLGFSASAFRGVHFDIVSLKPTVFLYQVLEDGSPHFCPRAEIPKNGLAIENGMPFLPTAELLYLYDKSRRNDLTKAPIYVVSKQDYLHNR